MPGVLDSYTRKNTFSVFGEYSNDSSHIILGTTPNRKLGAAGFGYERRLVQRGPFTLAYTAEVRPLVIDSDPVSYVTVTTTFAGMAPATSSFSNVAFECHAGNSSFTFNQPAPIGTYTQQFSVACGRRSTFAQAASPVGLRVHLGPRRPLQLTFSSNGGYMFSTKPIPIPNAGSFNFTFNFGAGLEYYYGQHRSARLEYLVQHYSNHYTAFANPGVDSGFVRLTFAFGH